MKKSFFVWMLSAFVLVSCTIRTHTANSLADIRWKQVETPEVQFQVKTLDCDRVDSCTSKGLFPDKYVLSESNVEVYVWAHKYFRLFSTYSTVLYVVVNRPNQNTWDMMGFEYLYGEWNVGVYKGGKTSWEIMPAGLTGGSIALGMSTEPWAVIVTPTDKASFKYSLYEYYWNR